MRNFKQFLTENDLDSFYIKQNQITNGKFDPSLLPFPNQTDDFYITSSEDKSSSITSLEGCPSIVDSFVCEYSKLTSLKYCPKIVNGMFSISNSNYITSLEYGPTYVGGGYYINNTSITSLEGTPKQINKTFNCADTKINSLDYAPLIAKKDVYTNDNNIKQLSGIGRKYLKQIDQDFWIPENLESNILGLCLIKQVKAIRCFTKNDDLKEVLSIIKKYLHTPGDECAEELKQNRFNEYAKF
jgi:hypothetical protein